jgi:hypothetical protein
MKSGIGIFIAGALALGASWCGFVLAPSLQLGGAKLATVLNSTDTYPLQRSGDAALGLQVYRAQGCAACHTEVVRQDGVVAKVTLNSLGTSKPEDFKAFVFSLFVVPELAGHTNALMESLKDWKGELPKTFLVTTDKAVADDMVKRVNAAGAKSQLQITATGADINRSWGMRRSVAEDYLYDQPVQLGNLRAGPDLANISARQPVASWHLSHLYAPKSVVAASAMPSFKYLFQVRRIPAGSAPSPDALNLPKEYAPAEGFEVVPTADAKNLTAYLLSLRANVPLFEAPFTADTTAKP